MPYLLMIERSNCPELEDCNYLFGDLSEVNEKLKNLMDDEICGIEEVLESDRLSSTRFCYSVLEVEEPEGVVYDEED